MDWMPLDPNRHLETGHYLVGHHGHQEKLSYFSPRDQWMPGTILGWRRLTAKGWERDDPAARFNATHYVKIKPPPRT